MLVLLLQFLAGAAGVVVAGSFLTRYADTIGEKTRLGRTLAGALLLATATSLPELAVDSQLALAGQADLIMGDLLGSSLMNLLILAILDLVHRGPTRLIAASAAAHALSATMSIVLTAIGLLFLLTPFEWTIARMGPGPLVIVVTYILGLRLVYHDQRSARRQLPPEEAAPADSQAISLRRAIVGYVICALGVLLAAPVLASSAEGLAEVTGLGGTFIGTTLVALCTSAPEAVTAFSAVRVGAFDLAAGNIFGSNAFNMAVLLPVDAIYDGSLLASAGPTHAVTAVCVVIATSMTILGLLYRPERRFWFIEPDAALVIFVVLSSLGLVYYLR